MNLNKLNIFLAAFAMSANLAVAQGAPSEVAVEGNLLIKDNPATDAIEGGLRATKNFVLSDGSPSTSFATGRHAIAIGNKGRAIGEASIAICSDDGGNGYYTNAYGLYNIAIGWAVTAGKPEDSTSYNLAFGTGAVATGGDGSVAISRWSSATGSSSFAMGPFAKATSTGNMAIGYSVEATGFCAQAFGSSSKALHTYSQAIGFHAVSNGYHGMALGHYTNVSHTSTYALGRGLDTDTEMQAVVGFYNKLDENITVKYWEPTHPVFVVGNGKNADNRSNALVVYKNGNANLSGDLEANNMKIRNPAGGIGMGEFGRP